MKIYLTPPFESRGIQRVVAALTQYLPKGFETTDNKWDADLVTIHAIGRVDHLSREVEELIANDIPYIVIQYAIRSTLRPNTKDWVNIWNRAEFVWSYYDLKQLCREDDTLNSFRFYHAPLGTDSNIFYEKSIGRDFKITTCSLSYLTESVRECVIAADTVGARVFHIGEELNKPKVTCRTNMADYKLAEYYSRSEYVSGLRRVEGFELPAVEGLFCGARPIMFDRPHYRKWFDRWAIFIPELPREQVIDSLVGIFKQPTRPVTLEEIAEARQLFDWQSIINNFWEFL